MDRRPFTITKLHRDDKGIWYARVTVDGEGHDVDRKYGSWRLTPAVEGGPYRELLPGIVHALQDKVRPIEKAERIAREKLARLGPKDTEALEAELQALDARARGELEVRSQPKETVSFTPPSPPSITEVLKPDLSPQPGWVEIG